MIKNFIIGLLLITTLSFGFAFFNQGEVVIPLGSGSGSEHYNKEFFRDGLFGSKFSEGGGIITVATTSATYTLTQAELASGNVISISSVAGAAALALTLPATSTMTTLLADVGEARTWYIENLHTAAATTTTITAGTGIELQGIATGDDVINGGVWGKLACYREASRNVTCIVNEYVAAD